MRATSMRESDDHPEPHAPRSSRPGRSDHLRRERLRALRLHVLRALRLRKRRLRHLPHPGDRRHRPGHRPRLRRGTPQQRGRHRQHRRRPTALHRRGLHVGSVVGGGGGGRGHPGQPGARRRPAHRRDRARHLVQQRRCHRGPDHAGRGHGRTEPPGVRTAELGRRTDLHGSSGHHGGGEAAELAVVRDGAGARGRAYARCSCGAFGDPGEPLRRAYRRVE